jgi:hypothetical protein
MLSLALSLLLKSSLERALQTRGEGEGEGSVTAVLPSYRRTARRDSSLFVQMRPAFFETENEVIFQVRSARSAKL